MSRKTTLLLELRTLKIQHTVDMFPEEITPIRRPVNAITTTYRAYCKGGSNFEIPEELAQCVLDAAATPCLCLVELELTRPTDGSGLFKAWQGQGETGYEDDESSVYLPDHVEQSMPGGNRLLFTVRAVSHPAMATRRRKWECVCTQGSRRYHVQEDKDGSWTVEGITPDLFTHGCVLHLAYNGSKKLDVDCPEAAPLHLVGHKVYVDPKAPAGQ